MKFCRRKEKKMKNLKDNIKEHKAIYPSGGHNLY